MNNLVLDLRGPICPSCLLVALKALNDNRNRIKKGRTVLVILTDQGDVARMLHHALTATGYDVNVERKEGYYETRINKKKGH